MEENSKNRCMPYQDEEIDLLISLMPKFMRKSSGSIAWQKLASEFNKIMLEKYPTLYTERNKLSLHAKFNYLVKHQAKKTYDSHSVNPLIKRALDISKFIGQRKGRLPVNEEENEDEEGDDEIELQSEGEEGVKEDEDDSDALEDSLKPLPQTGGTIVHNENTPSRQVERTILVNRFSSSPLSEDLPRAKKQRTVSNGSASLANLAAESSSLGPPNLVPGVDDNVNSVLLFQHFSSLLLQLRREDQEREDRRRREDFERENYRIQAEQQRLLQLIQAVLLHGTPSQTPLPSSFPPPTSDVFCQSSDCNRQAKQSEQSESSPSKNEKVVSFTEWEKFQKWKELQALNTEEVKES